jgi:hypothetical protein
MERDSIKDSDAYAIQLFRKKIVATVYTTIRMILLEEFRNSALNCIEHDGPRSRNFQPSQIMRIIH